MMFQKKFRFRRIECWCFVAYDWFSAKRNQQITSDTTDLPATYSIKVLTPALSHFPKRLIFQTFRGDKKRSGIVLDLKRGNEQQAVLSLDKIYNLIKPARRDGILFWQREIIAIPKNIGVRQVSTDSEWGR